MPASKDVLEAICGADRYQTFREVKFASMRLAKVARTIARGDLRGEISAEGKQFLLTDHGLWRLASGSNSDNSTERLAHEKMGARPVQIFGEVSALSASRGVFSLDALYALHARDLDENAFLAQLERLV